MDDSPDDTTAPDEAQPAAEAPGQPAVDTAPTQAAVGEHADPADPAPEVEVAGSASPDETTQPEDDDPDQLAGDFTSPDIDLSHLTVEDDEDGGDTSD